MRLMHKDYPHRANRVFFSCIDDRLTVANNKFIKQHEGAFHPAMAGGAAAIVDPHTRAIAVRQIVAPYLIAGATIVFLESHTDCGAYRLAGVTFDTPEQELRRLKADLDKAATIVHAALLSAGAKAGKIEIFTLVVDPGGREQFYDRYLP